MCLSMKIINKRERMPTCLPQETPPESASLSFLEGGPSLIFPVSRMLASDYSNSDVPKSNPVTANSAREPRDQSAPKGVQRTSMLILERVRELENRDKLSERRKTWYFWLKCWFLTSKKALTMYPSLIR